MNVTGTDQIEITSGLLDNYDQLWIMSTNFSSSGVFSQAEIDAILSFQGNGGGLFIAADHTGGGVSAGTDANQISTSFGVTFSGWINHGHSEIYPFIVSHPLCENVGSIWGHWSEAEISVTSAKIEIIAIHNGYSMIAVLDEWGEGRIVFDTSFVRMEDGGDPNGHDILKGDNVQYAKNIANWLGKGNISEKPSLINHIYGDDGLGTDGIYTMTLTVTDNQGATATDTCIVTVENVAPWIEPFGPFMTEEGIPFCAFANATDPGSDDLTFTWNWGDGTYDISPTYYNNGVGPDPYPSPFGTFPFSANDTAQHTYTKGGIYTINLTVEDDDGGVSFYITRVTVIGIETPNLFINLSQDGEDAILYWDPPQTLDIEYYLIYRSTSQIGFDFSVVWKNTLIDKELGELNPLPLRTMWNDTNAAFPGNETNYEEQFYYTIRAVNIFGKVSRTSRTVGKWTKIFPKGVSAFSLPLEPLQNLTIDHCLRDMNAKYIKWMHPGSHKWMKYGEGGINDTLMKVSEAYEVKLGSQINYTFTGMPGAMISYDDDSGFSGFDHTTEAKNLRVKIESNGDVNLTWQEPMNMSDGWYEIYFSSKRDGFFKTPGVHYRPACLAVFFGTNATTIAGLWANNPGVRLYIMIIPFNATGFMGSSTYSIGIWTEEYLSQYDTLGLPLKLDSNHTADWYCENIRNAVGINYYITSEQRWCWHSERMPAEAYDPILMMTEGYQISTSNNTKYTFIGV